MFAWSYGGVLHVAVRYFSASSDELTYYGSSSDVLAAIFKGKILHSEVFDCSAHCTEETGRSIRCCRTFHFEVLYHVSVAVECAGISVVVAVRVVIKSCLADSVPIASFEVDVVHKLCRSGSVDSVDIFCEPEEVASFRYFVVAVYECWCLVSFVLRLQRHASA